MFGKSTIRDLLTDKATKEICHRGLGIILPFYSSIAYIDGMIDYEVVCCPFKIQ